MLRNIALVISYDGTQYTGWQVQKGLPSVQGTIEKALEDLHGFPVSLIGAGRTDAGVHATGQVGNFFTEKDTIPDWQFREALNARLPRDVQILRSQHVDDTFHSRRNAVARFYEYRIAEGRAFPAHLARFIWLIPRLPSLVLLNSMASIICGQHDFTAFAMTGDSSPCKHREVYHAVFLNDGPQILFRISGNAFLWKMVRSLLGTIIDTALRGGDRWVIKGILDSRDRSVAGPTAPARGLFLTRVEYGQKWGFQ